MLVILAPRAARADELDAGVADAKPAHKGTTGDTLAAIRDRGELLWGADAQGGAPYIFQDPRDPNHIVGFEVDVADALADKLGVKARPVQGQWEKLLELLERGDFDVAINGIEVNDEKLRVCELSNPYYVAAEKLTVRAADANAPRDLATVTGRPAGTLPSSTAERILGRAGADVHTYDGGQDDIYKDLLLKRTDAVLLDEPISKYYGAIEPELRVVDGSFGEVRYAAAVKKGDVALKAAIDSALADLAADGTLKKIYLRWGLWNPETAALFHDPDAASATSLAASTVAEGWEAWRAAVGKRPPFWQRVRTQYPAMIGLFAKGAAVTLTVCVLAMLLAVLLGALLAVTRSFAPTLRDLSLEVASGSIVGILGKSGAGKSTLLRVLSGLDSFERGSIDVGGVTVAAASSGARATSLRGRVGLVFQSLELFPHLTVLENVLLAPVKIHGKPGSKSLKQALKLLRELDVADKAKEHPEALSGGQKQRVAIVRALMVEPQVLLYDEPTSALDPELKAEVGKTLTRVAESTGMTQVVVTHDPKLADSVCKAVFVLEDGQLKRK